MLRKIIVVLVGVVVSGLGFSDTSMQSASSAMNTAVDPAAGDVVPALVGGLNADHLQSCVNQINQRCNALTSWEKKDACMQQFFAANTNLCAQAQAIYQKQGLLPYRIQTIGPVTVFTFNHIADGQETFHIVDPAGHLIDLVDDQNPAIAASAEFQKIQASNPGAGLMQLVSGKVSESPQVIMPKQLANKKGEEILQLIFPQYVKLPPCLACQTVAIADIAYRFSYPEGKFLNVAWAKTEAANAQADVVDPN